MSDAILNVEHLCKSFSKDGERIEAVRDVSFELRCGECVGLIGESGSGKSTVANLIAGLETADGGRIIMNGTDLLDRKDRAGVHACRSKLQMIFQNPRLSFNPAMTIGQGVEEAVKYFQRIPAKQRHEMMLERLRQVGLPEAYADKKASQLSGGECQRIKLASYLVMGESEQPKLFIFDEPSTGLHFHDIDKLLSAFDRLISAGHSIVVIEHHHDIIKVADWIIDMGPGGGDAGGNVVFAGTPEDLLKCPDSFTAKYLHLD
jgi:excinuclease UvrABC ATPase subunit